MMNSYKRRDFLRLGSGLLAGLAIAPMACNSESDGDKNSTGDTSMSKSTASAASLAAFGLQLYTLRDKMPDDPKEMLKQAASFGYKQIESYEGKDGIFWGMSNTDFKKYMDDLGMTIISSHCDINKDFEKKVDEAAAIDMKYLMCPWKGPTDPDTNKPRTIDDYKKIAEEFNAKGEICKKAGIRFAYHNHDYSFKPIDGLLPQNVMMDNTDPSLVDFEMDIYWVVTAGQDPQEWFKKYSNRFRACHVKDRSKTPVEDNGKNSVNLGTGSIDFPAILKTAKENGMQYYIVEQEAYTDETPLEAAKADAEYMKLLKI